MANKIITVKNIEKLIYDNKDYILKIIYNSFYAHKDDFDIVQEFIDFSKKNIKKNDWFSSSNSMKYNVTPYRREIPILWPSKRDSSKSLILNLSESYSHIDFISRIVTAIILRTFARFITSDEIKGRIINNSKELINSIDPYLSSNTKNKNIPNLLDREYNEICDNFRLNPKDLLEINETESNKQPPSPETIPSSSSDNDRLKYVVEGNGKTNEFDREKELSSDKTVYLYVWWLFDSNNDFKSIAANPHAYPRQRPGVKNDYEEVKNKNIIDKQDHPELLNAMKGEKGLGGIYGTFIGGLKLVGRKKVFTDILPLKALKKGEVIGLGVARINRRNWRIGNYNLFKWSRTDEELIDSDPEKLLWKWVKWSGSASTKKEANTKADAKKKINANIEKLKKNYKFVDEKNNSIRINLKWHFKGDYKLIEEIKENFNMLLSNHDSSQDEKLEKSINDLNVFLEMLLIAWSEGDSVSGNEMRRKLTEIKNKHNFTHHNFHIMLEGVLNKLT